MITMCCGFCPCRSWVSLPTPKSSLAQNDAEPASLSVSTEGGGDPVMGGGAALDPADMGTKRALVLFHYDAVVPQEISVVKDEVRCGRFTVVNLVNLAANKNLAN